jgi:hypothetical protein
MTRRTRQLPVVITAVALLISTAACAGDPTPPATGVTATAGTSPAAPSAVGPSTPAGAQTGDGESSIGPTRLTAGQKAEAAAEGTALEVIVADPKIIKAPDGWGDGSIVIATVTYNVLDGQIEYDENDFALVLADGERITASTVASDTGLPGRALGSGPLTGPDKAKGLVTFDHDTKSLDGLRIQWTASPAGFTWTLA